MGGKPSKGTPKDGRLKSNQPGPAKGKGPKGVAAISNGLNRQPMPKPAGPRAFPGAARPFGSKGG